MTSPLVALKEQIGQHSDLPSPQTMRALRVAAGASLDDVAQVVGVTRQAVALWEAGARTPRGANRTCYLQVLQIFREEIGRRAA